tara:strand:- start:184 stop:936 length:753 start_codon:yes stop_codon:yes gene_type:complete
MKIKLLGTSAAIPTRARSLPSIHVKTNSTALLLDCGDGTTKRITEAKESIFKINAILFSHMHSDHMFGLPAIWNSMSLLKKTETLHIYGPEGTLETIQKLIDVDSREIPFKISINDVKPGETFEIGNIDISCAKAEHGVPALAYRLESGGKSIVYTGDTKPTKTIEELSKDVDLLIHDSTFLSPNDAERYNHSTPEQAAKVAKNANVGKLVLTHLSQRHKNPDDFLEQAKTNFDNVVVAEDLMEIEVGKD